MKDPGSDGRHRSEDLVLTKAVKPEKRKKNLEEASEVFKSEKTRQSR